MKDTSDAFESKYRDMLLECSGEERVKMGRDLGCQRIKDGRDLICHVGVCKLRREYARKRAMMERQQTAEWSHYEKPK